MLLAFLSLFALCVFVLSYNGLLGCHNIWVFALCVNRSEPLLVCHWAHLLSKKSES